MWEHTTIEFPMADGYPRLNKLLDAMKNVEGKDLVSVASVMKRSLMNGQPQPYLLLVFRGRKVEASLLSTERSPNDRA